jgi:hypothetical protein
MAPSSPVDEERGDSDQIMSDPGQFMSDPVEPQLPAQLDLPASEVGPSILTAALGERYWEQLPAHANFGFRPHRLV